MTGRSAHAGGHVEDPLGRSQFPPKPLGDQQRWGSGSGSRPLGLANGLGVDRGGRLSRQRGDTRARLDAKEPLAV